MKRQLKWVFFSLLTIQQVAHADSHACDEQAPLHDSGFYFNINDPAPLTNKQRHMLRQLAKNVTGRWYGAETVAHCEGHFQSPSMVRYEYLVKAEISTSARGEVRLTAEKEPYDRSVTKRQTLWLSPETEMQTTRQRWQTIEFVDQNTVIYSHKYHARNRMTAGQPTTRLIHEIKKLRVQNDKLSIDRKLYVNGFIVERSGIRLRKPA